jgi:hypothetical protein
MEIEYIIEGSVPSVGQSRYSMCESFHAKQTYCRPPRHISVTQFVSHCGAVCRWSLHYFKKQRRISREKPRDHKYVRRKGETECYWVLYYLTTQYHRLIIFSFDDSGEKCWFLIMLFFWVTAPCRLLGRYQRFGEACSLHLQGWSLEEQHYHENLIHISQWLILDLFNDFFLWW